MFVFGASASVPPVPAGAYDSPSAGRVEAIAGTGTFGYSGDGGPALSARMGAEGKPVVDPSTGNLVFSDNNNSVVRVVALADGTFYGQSMSAGNIYTIAGTGEGGYSGDGGPGPSAELLEPSGIAVDSAGNVAIADTRNDVVRLVAMSSGVVFGSARTAGYIYALAGSGTEGNLGDGGPALEAEFDGPYGVAFDNAVPPNLLISEYFNSVVRVVAASTDTFYGQSMTALDVYRIAGALDASSGYSGDGGPATAAHLYIPTGITVDTHGNVLVADWQNSRVRAVAGATGTFYAVAMTTGNIYTIAGNGAFTFAGDGGPATSASLNYPNDVAVDAAGNAVIADTFNDRVRVVAGATGTFYGQAMTVGRISTIAGNGTHGFSGDGGPALSAQLDWPIGVWADGDGNILIEDHGSYEIRAVGGAPVACDSPSGPASALTVESAVVPDTQTPPQSAASQWTATVSNPSDSTESCVSVHFTVDIGTLNSIYGVVSQGSGCTFTTISGSNASAVACDLGAIGAGLDATAMVAIQAKGVKPPATITATVVTSSNRTGGDSAQSMISVVAPTPGTVTSFVPPNGLASTDKKSTLSATVVAKMKLPKKVGSPTLVISAGSFITMNRFAQSTDSVLCPASTCSGDIIKLDPFTNYTDAKHPATLSLVWDPSVLGSGLASTLYMRTAANPGVASPVESCVKVNSVQTVLPCVSKKSLNLRNVLTFTVLILSSNDPGFGFARR